MRNLDIIAKEIVELSEIKSAYNHYLSSHRSLTEVENTTQLQHNRLIIAQSIHLLKAEIKSRKALEIRQKPKVKPKTITYTNEEKNAILHFNRDRRFTITE